MESKIRVATIANTFSNQIKRESEINAAHIGITRMQARIIYKVYEITKYREVFQKDIEEEYDIRRASATGILKLMEKNNLMKRESVEYDARLKKIILTDKAIALLEQIEKNAKLFEERLTQGISKEELAFFYSIIEKMSKNLG